MQSQSDMPTADWMKTIPSEQKIGIVVPLYGYWSDLSSDQLDWETLSAFLANLNSKNLKCYTVFTSEIARASRNVQNVLLGRSKGGGMEVVDMDRYSTYGDYVHDGIEYLLENTDCQFIVVANPWVMLRKNSVDQLAEKLNMSSSNLVCGVDLRTLKWGTMDGIPADQFDSFNFNPPMDAENKEFNPDFWGMTRQVAQILKIDTDYKTVFYQSPDIWGSLFTMGLGVIASQFLPYWSFDIDWKAIESKEAFEDDKKKFTEKWRFVPDNLVDYDKLKT